ncbi:MAG: hypothetical protein HFI91_11210 [Lachnospiraceae bacterium]|jgi:hypothetical protein|nr:hypothetical protein [Lachnospiraceae bacterium]
MMETYNDFSWLKNYLAPDEQVVWRGKPMEGKIFSRNDIFMIPFSILWGGFAIFWEFSVLLMPTPFFFKLWGIPFVLVGLYMMAGRFFVQEYRKKRTYYAITDKRILQLQGNKLSVLERRQLPEMHMTVDKDGSGTIAFDRYGRGRFRYMWAGGLFADASGQSGQVDPLLENIPNVNQVYQILSGQIQELHSPGVTWNTMR